MFLINKANTISYIQNTYLYSELCYHFKHISGIQLLFIFGKTGIQRCYIDHSPILFKGDVVLTNYFDYNYIELDTKQSIIYDSPQKIDNFIINQSISFINIAMFRQFNSYVSNKINSQLIIYQIIFDKISPYVKLIRSQIETIKYINVLNHFLYKFQKCNSMIFNDKLTHQSLRLDLQSDRMYNMGKSFIKYNHAQLKKHFKLNDKKVYIKIDVVSSVLTLFCFFFNININNKDIYQYLGKQMGIVTKERQQLKKIIFNIIFNRNKIQKFVHIQFFKKVKLVGQKFKQEFDENGYICSAFSKRKIHFNEKEVTYGRMLNKFLFNMQGQIYSYIINLLISKFNIEQVRPILIRYDQFIVQIDKGKFLSSMEDIYNTVSLNGKLQIRMDKL